uniref:ATP synthase complex subunit 8 n=1 Tax=Chaetodontoplus septentrionalis TaxID=215363 RepID=A8E231_9TELE|nr:ATP synthase F0 subunit 8 [Chaetodontoplus septentrionalis]BAF80419.1 ATPase subunit 8 [Chaetodontoplus septentrionalis]
MPQLNPRPWMAILMFTWVVFLTVIPTKIIEHCFPNEQIDSAPMFSEPDTWLWPWL